MIEADGVRSTPPLITPIPGLNDAALVLDALAAGTQPDRARLIAGALALDTLVRTTNAGRDLQDAAAGLQILATAGTLDLDETGRLRARQFAETVRQLISDPIYAAIEAHRAGLCDIRRGGGWPSRPTLTRELTPLEVLVDLFADIPVQLQPAELAFGAEEWLAKVTLERLADAGFLVVANPQGQGVSPMTKAAKRSSTTGRDEDAELIALYRRHERLWREWGRTDEPMTTADLMDKCEWIAREVLGTPAHTRRGLAAKRRVLRLAEFCDPNDLVGSILHFDAERIAAAS